MPLSDVIARRADDDVRAHRRRELHPFDVAQLVRAVERVLDRMRDDDLAVRSRGEGILATRALKLGDVDVSRLSCPSLIVADDARAGPD